MKDGRLIRAAIGTLTDGVSTPRSVWNVIAPFDWWMCGVLHDAAYKDTIEMLDPVKNTWDKLTMTEAQANDLLDEALISRGCGEVERNTIYIALKAFGKFAFNDDRNGVPAPSTVPC
jgi:hypothetical protein